MYAEQFTVQIDHTLRTSKQNRGIGGTLRTLELTYLKMKRPKNYMLSVSSTLLGPITHITRSSSWSWMHAQQTMVQLSYTTTAGPITTGKKANPQRKCE